MLSIVHTCLVMLYPQPATVSFRYHLGLGLGFFALFFTSQGIHILAIPFYQMTLGVDPFLLSLVMTAPLLIASAIGPYVGHLSDRCRSTRGRRRPFIFFAAWATGLSYGCIWMVPPHWSNEWQLVYFALMCLLFYISSVFFTVPLNSLAYELTDDYHQRTEVMGFAAYFLKFASLVYQWVFPVAKLAVFGGVFVGIQYVGWGLAIMVFGCLGMMPALLIHERPVTQGAPRRQLLWPNLSNVIRQPSMRLLMLLTLIQMAGAAGAATLDYYLLVYYVSDGDIGQGAVWKGLLSSAYALVSILCIPLVTRLSLRRGKLAALQYIYGLNALGGVAKWFIFVPGAGAWIVLDALLCGAIWTAMVVLIPSMIADLNQQSRQQGNTGQAGILASVHGWVLSISGVLALLGGGLALNAIGFDAGRGAAQASSTLLAMRMILAGGTVLFSLLPLLLLHYCRRRRQNVLMPWLGNEVVCLNKNSSTS